MTEEGSISSSVANPCIIPVSLQKYLLGNEEGPDVDVENVNHSDPTLDVSHETVGELFDYLLRCDSDDALPHVSVLKRASLIISKVILSISDDFCFSIVELFSRWQSVSVKETSGQNNSMFLDKSWPKLLSILKAAACVPTLLVLYHTKIRACGDEDSTQAPTSQLIPEECFDRSLWFVGKFLSINYSLHKHTSEISPSTPQKRLQGSKSPRLSDESVLLRKEGMSTNEDITCNEERKSVISKKLVTEINKNVYTAVYNYFRFISRHLFYFPSQPERVLVVLYQLSFTALRCNLSVTVSKTTTNREGSSRQALSISSLSTHCEIDLMKLSISLLSQIFRQNPSCRSGIIEELCPFLSQCYSFPTFYPKVIALPITDDNNIGVKLLSTPGYAILSSIFHSLAGSCLHSELGSSDYESNVSYLQSVHRSQMGEYYSCVLSLLKMLFRRCAQKETIGYRDTVNELIYETLSHSMQSDSSSDIATSHLLSPTCPFAAFFLNQCVAVLISELQPLLHSTEKSSSNESLSASYILFLIDIISGMGSKLREVVVTVKNEEKYDGNEIHEDTLELLRQQVKSLKVKWDREIELQERGHKSAIVEKNTAAEVAASNKKKKKKSNKAEVQHVDDGPLPGLGFSAMIEATISLGATVLDVFYDHDLQVDASNKAPAGNVTPTSEVRKRQNAFKGLSTVPDLRTILMKVGWDDDDIGRYFPHISSLSATDIRQAYVLNHLYHLFVASLGSRKASLSSICHPCSDAGTFSPCGLALGDVVSLHYFLWLRFFHYKVDWYFFTFLSRDAVSRESIILGEYLAQQSMRHKQFLLSRNIIPQSSVFSDGAGTPVNHHAKWKSKLSAQDEYSGTMSIDIYNQKYDNSVVYSPAWASICYRHICVNRWLINDSLKIVHTLTLLMASQSSSNIRARCMKGLGSLVRCDSGLLNDKQLQGMILERFNDVAISVREETVKLIGKYLLNALVQGTDDEKDKGYLYLDALITRLRDKGISVRKSAANTMREILLHQPDHPRYTEICRCLLERCWLPKEETTLKDVIQNTFQQIWFSPPPTSAFTKDGHSSDSPRHVSRSASADGISDHRDIVSPSRCEVPSLSRVQSTPLPSAGPGESARRLDGDQQDHMLPKTPQDQHIETTAYQIVEVLSFGVSEKGYDNMEDSESQWLVQMLRGMLHDGRDCSSSSGGATYDSRQLKQRREMARSHCQKLVKSLMELLLRTEEAMHRNRLGGGDGDGKNTHSDRVVGIFVTLGAFCEAHPPFVVPHLHTLLPYLKGDNHLSVKQEERVCLKLVNMLSQGFLCASSPISLSPSKAGMKKSNVCRSPNVQSEYGDLRMQCAAWISESTDIANELTRISLKYGNAKVIEAAVSCLAQLCQYITRDPKPIHILAEKCFCAIARVASDLHARYLDSNSSREETSSKLPGSSGFYSCANAGQLARLQRCIIVMGFICEQTSQCSVLNISSESDNIISGLVDSHPRFTSHDEDFRIANSSLVSLCPFGSNCPYAPANCDSGSEVIKSFPVWSLNGACFLCSYFLLHVGSETAQSRALQALCSVFVGNPKLMILAESWGLISHSMQQSPADLSYAYGDNAHEKLLRGLNHVLTMEEKRLEKQAAIKQMNNSGVDYVDSNEVKGEGGHSADASITGSILQHHLPLLLDYFFHKNSNLRYAALELLGSLLSHGMVHPLDAISWLIGLQGDPEEGIRKASLCLLQIEDEKHSSFFDNRLLEGLEMAFTLQCKREENGAIFPYWVYHDSVERESSVASSKVVSVFAPLYNSCIKPHRKRKADFVIGVLRKCQSALKFQLDSYEKHKDDCLSCNSWEKNCTPRKSEGCKNADGYNMFLISKVDQKEKSLLGKRTESQRETFDCYKLASNRNKAMISKLSPGLRKSAVKNSAHAQSPLHNSDKKGLQSSRNNSTDENTLRMHLLETVINGGVKLVSFLTATLASIPFDTVEEPLHIVYWINRNLSVEISDFARHMHHALRTLGCKTEAKGEDDDDTVLLVPFTDTAAAAVEKSRGSDSQKMKGQNFECETLVPLAREWLTSVSHAKDYIEVKANDSMDSLVMQQLERASLYVLYLSLGSLSREVILRLKEYMKITYSLNNDRCASFSPSHSGSSATSSAFQATEGGIAMENKFDPLPPLKQQNTFDYISTILNSDNEAQNPNKDIPALWQTMTLGVADYNRLHVLHSEGECDFNVDSVLSKRDAKGRGVKKSASRGRNAKRGRPTKSKSLKSKAAGGEEKGDDSGEEYIVISKSLSSIPVPGQASGRSSNRKKRKTTKLGDYAIDGGVEVDIENDIEAEEL